MKMTLAHCSFVLLAALTLLACGGCKVSEWFAARPPSPQTPPLAQGRPNPERNAGYLGGGPTFSNVQAGYEPSETATERAIRLRAENERLHAAIATRDQQIADWQQRYETQQRLLKRVEGELQVAITGVKKSSQQLDQWQSELAKLYEKTRSETEASAQAFESLSRQVKSLLQRTGHKSGLPDKSTPSPGNATHAPQNGTPARSVPESILPPPVSVP